MQEFLSSAILHDVHSLASFAQLHPALLQTLDFPESVEHCEHFSFFHTQPRSGQVSSVPERQMSVDGVGVTVGDEDGSLDRVGTNDGVTVGMLVGEVDTVIVGIVDGVFVGDGDMALVNFMINSRPREPPSME